LVTPPPSPFSFTLIGAGRVGTAVAELLRRAGHRPVAVASRSELSAARAAGLLGCPVTEVKAAVRNAEVVVLGVPAGAIEEMAASIAPHLHPGPVVVHLAGTVGLDPLHPVRSAGALGAALHPVQACPDVDTAIARLPGSAWGITTDESIEEWARAVVTDDLQGSPVIVDEAARPLWHAAAVMTSNGIAALLTIGESLLQSISITHPEDVLGPLAHGTVQNAIEGGGGGATLTGPIVRGEMDAVSRQMDAIESADPRLSPAFRLGARLILEAAVGSGRVADEAAAGWRRLLETER
jgi:predicted short-subunit dehydrogenase-like oxidoreductase (DUF2520 family)